MKASAQTLFAGLGWGFGGLCGGALGGWIAETWGYAVLYRSFGAVAGVSLVLLYALVPSDRGGEG